MDRSFITARRLILSQLVYEDTGQQLGLEPCGLGRHDLPGIRYGHHFLDGHPLHGERNRRLAGIDFETHRNNGSIAKTLLFVAALALHKIPEGLAVGVSFGTGDIGDVLTVAGAISVQNIPEAFVIVAPLFAIAVAPIRIILISLAIALVSIVCVLSGYALVSAFAGALPFLLAAAGGAMLYVISDEMIPESHAHGFEKPATFALIAGVLLVLALQNLL